MADRPKTAPLGESTSGKLNPRAKPFVAPEKDTIEPKLPYATVCDGCGKRNQPPGEQWSCCSAVSRTILWVDPNYVNTIYRTGLQIKPTEPSATPALEAAAALRDRENARENARENVRESISRGSASGENANHEKANHENANRENASQRDRHEGEEHETQAGEGANGSTIAETNGSDTGTIADAVVAKFKRLRAVCSSETARAEKYEELYRNLQAQLNKPTPSPAVSRAQSPGPPPEQVTFTSAASASERVNLLTTKPKPSNKPKPAARPSRPLTPQPGMSFALPDAHADCDDEDSEYTSPESSATSTISSDSTYTEVERSRPVECGWALWRERWFVAYKLMPHMIWHKRASSGDAMFEVMREMLADLEAIECGCDVEFVRGIWAVLTQLLPQLLRLDNKPHTEFFVKMLVQLDIQVQAQQRCGE